MLIVWRTCGFFSSRLVVVKYFREGSEAQPIPLLLLLSAILAVATKSQLGSILAWDLDAEHLLLRELESSASDPSGDYHGVSTSPGKLIVSSIESHLKSSVVGNVLRIQMARITSRRSFEGCWP